ncbi:response regulator [Chitinispirillales bacterium ANBcel5]|uniref:response regulator n=1 Tax=Cellulosispirillum alkaliphilum TaxID=3039283 RepID=UPI002A5352C7|nr:response regulator [Chitinispirillales bacterium ANBcel5]
MHRKLQVVVVDDETQITELLKTFIEISSDNIIVYTFNDPLKALQFIQNNKVDTLITDYMMPGIDGIELMEAVEPHIKKIIISGYVSELAEERIEKLEATVFEKPVPMKELGAIIFEQQKELCSV